MHYGVTVGSGEFSKMAIWQLRSIHLNTPTRESSIIANCPPEEWVELTPSQRDEISSLAKVRKVDPPLPDYPLSAFYATGRACVEETDDDEWFALLDTDTIVLNDISDGFDPSHDLAAKPVDFHPNRVGLSEYTIRRAFEIGDVSIPQESLRSTVDKKVTSPPLYNGGVLFINNKAVIESWIDLTSDLYEEFPDEFFIEQLALAVVSVNFEVQELTEQFNFPLPQRLWTPHTTRILHYHEPIEMSYVMNPLVYHKLSKIGVFKESEPVGVLSRIKRFGVCFARLRLRFK